MTTKKKRNLFEEIKQGILEIKDHNAGKITLRTHKLEKNPHPISSGFNFDGKKIS